ncbi:hypothetical protein [Desulfoscipio geothermicus]|uniref:Uncharacterized protein n=1 Tax=Desulfoscipio geothermicus DSM 3669 TaxID=1121426 RepID=A0A1I6ECH1_9FIRM|nr:hypothetical protein [Desulfoscipio geothermicus]SFR15405.1 hypothetical protein SAMN05660706_13546 [Desulfoscipio geothermicus DSM 3669]
MSELYVAIEKDKLDRLRQLAASQTKKQRRLYINADLREAHQNADVVRKIIELLAYETSTVEEALRVLTLTSITIEEAKVAMPRYQKRNAIQGR